MNYYMCPICYQVYNGDYIKGTKCPNLNCNSYDTKIFEIDETMIEPIRILNKAGFATRNCCSGHLYSNSSPYIQFYEKEDFNTLPVNWYKDENIPTVIRGQLDYPFEGTLLEKQQILFNRQYELLKWCNDLI